jgi:hypothetical protein
MFRPLFIAALACFLVTSCARQDTPAPAAGAPPAAAPAGGATPNPAPDQPAAAQPAQAAPAPVSEPTAAAPAITTPPPQRKAAPRTTAAKPMAAAPADREPAAAPDAEPAHQPPPEPQFREITIPAGRTISITLATAVASDTSKVEDAVRGTLASPIVVDDTTVVPAGARLTGTVIEANSSGRVAGKASVKFRFNRLDVRSELHDINTAPIIQEADSSKGDDVKKGAIGAGVGAVVGGIVGGGKGAAIGAGAGGAGAVLATKGREVRLPSGTKVTTTLENALTITVPIEKH